MVKCVVIVQVQNVKLKHIIVVFLLVLQVKNIVMKE